MSSWRDQILSEFTPRVARLILVADPDGLLLEEGIIECIRENGYELIPFDDRIAFRYLFESKYRSRWDRGEHSNLVVVLRAQINDFGVLPFDLLQSGRRLSFSLGNIFPNLSYPVVTELDRADLDSLYDAQLRHAPGILSENATKEFVLRHVFEIAPELIKKAPDLLRVLLRLHYSGQRIPKVLNERFIQLLRQNSQFKEWHLERLVTDRDSFFSFLQERWPIFLDHQAAHGTSGHHHDVKPYNLMIEGPADLSFDHYDIRIFIDNLFAEGLLHPIPHANADVLGTTWVGIGIRTVPAEDRLTRLNKLASTLKESIPGESARYAEWLHFARRWAEFIVILSEPVETNLEEMIEQASDLQSQVDLGFSNWLAKRYSGLVNLPPVPPVMQHHIPRYLARLIDDNHNLKIALIVLDGLSLDQWIILRNVLVLKNSGLRFREQAVFGWIPTLTAVSRQAIFAGRAPIYFPNSIQTTDKEPVLWSQFWADNGLASQEVFYEKGLGDTDLDSLSESLSNPKLRVVGLVIDKIDRIMHGMELGTAGMHNQVCQWANQSYLGSLLKLLINRDYRVFLTSDHGNIEARGFGRPVEGMIADLRGERVRIYSDSILRSKVKEKFPVTLEWLPIGLPEDYLPLIATGRNAFIQLDQRSVCHGGASIEELIVPFVLIEGNLGASDKPT